MELSALVKAPPVFPSELSIASIISAIAAHRPTFINKDWMVTKVLRNVSKVLR